VYFNDPGLINTALDKFNAVKVDDIKKAAAKYLVPQTRTVILALPDAKAAASSQQGGQ